MMQTKAYCNCLAQERGLEPAGHAGGFDDAIIVEAPLPWKIDMMQKPGLLPQQVIDLFALWLQRYYAGEGYPHRPLVVAPDPDYSQEGFRRVMFYKRPAGQFAEFDKVEYLIPEDQVGALIWALYEDRAALPQFEAYQVMDQTRDILICTHGTVDAACAKFGYPLYKHMRDIYSNGQTRIWRVSHFGGHVFAPTLMDMPTGHYWAYVGKEQAEQIIQRTGDVTSLKGYYRGWAGLKNGFLQTAEWQLWQAHGWDWFNYLKGGEIIAQDENTDDPTWADVRLTFGDSTAEMRVNMTHKVDTETTTGNETTYAHPQYQPA